MLLVKNYQVVNGNVKGRKYSKIMRFNNKYELEEERERLEKLHHGYIDFTPIKDVGDFYPSDDVLNDLF